MKFAYGKFKPYERNGLYSIESVLSLLDHEAAMFGGDRINLTSQRYQVFKKSTVCVGCGIEGQFFAKERHKSDEKYHFNLYAVNKNGHFVMMTKDHIIPKSKGGRNFLSNYQTMCHRCNAKKADKVEDANAAE